MGLFSLEAPAAPAKAPRWKRIGIALTEVSNCSKGTQFGTSWLVVIPAKVTGSGRIRRQFKDRASALAFAEGEANKAKEQGQNAFYLSPEDVIEARQALKLLEGLGISLIEAARYAAKHLRPKGGDISFVALKDRILREKQREGLRPASIQALRFYLSVLANHFGAETLIKTIGYDELSIWIDELHQGGASKRHIRNFIGYARQFFAYAYAHKFVADNPAGRLNGPRVDVKTPVVLKILEVKRLLRAGMSRDHYRLLPAVVLALFCGLRSEELLRLNWAHVDLVTRKVLVPSEVSKTRDPRTIEIPGGAVEFLLTCPKRTGMIAPPKFRNLLTGLHKSAGFTDWKKTHANSKRHSFGSYACKLHEWEWVITSMGNSVEMLKKHYRDANVTPGQAQEYFALSPANLEVPGELILLKGA